MGSRPHLDFYQFTNIHYAQKTEKLDFHWQNSIQYCIKKMLEIEIKNVEYILFLWAHNHRTRNPLSQSFKAIAEILLTNGEA